MEIQDRITGLGSYFKSFNIIDGLAYALVKFPSGWKLPDEEMLGEEFSVSTQENSDGVYFYIEMSEGVGRLFDAIDYTVSFNKAIEERLALFKECANKLKELFNTEDLEKLRTLEFTFGEPTGDTLDESPLPSMADMKKSLEAVKEKNKDKGKSPIGKKGGKTAEPVDKGGAKDESTPMMDLVEKIVEE